MRFLDMARSDPSPSLHHLEQLIAGLSAGIILMDPAGVTLSANAAALMMHGVARLDQLGLTVDDYCQRFDLSERGGARIKRRDYPLMRLLAGESFPDLVVEVRPAGEEHPCWIQHVRDVTMDDDGGDPDVLALVIQDVSDQFEAEDRFDAMFRANPAPATILRLSDKRFIRANDGFRDLTGYKDDALIGKTLIQIDLLGRVENKSEVIEQLTGGHTITQVEAEIPVADGSWRLVILAGQPIEIGDDRCMLFTFADLEPRRTAETALKASETHFSTVFEMAPVAMVITSPEEHGITQVNEAFRQLTGYADDAVLGRVADDLQLWDDAEQRRRLEEETRQHRSVRALDVRLLTKDGVGVDCLLSAVRFTLGGADNVLWIYQDISARRHSELELVAAIDAVMKDASWFSRSIMDKLASLRKTGRDDAPEAVDLTAREREVLELICEGLNDAALAKQLGLSPNTIRNHVARLYAKIGVGRRSDAIIWARERGIIGR